MPTVDPAVAFPADEFIRIPHVAIMDEHSADETHGAGKEDVTAADLEDMAEGINARWRETGDASRIVLGHTPPGQTAFTKSTGVGWATNAVVDDFFDTGRKGLFVDFYIKKRHADVIEKYPRRSIEYWRKTHTVDPIALLDDETPERFLGIVRYERDSQTELLTMSAPPTPKSSAMTDDAKTALTDAVAGETSGSKSIEAKLDALADKVGQMSEMFMQLLSMVESAGDGNHDDLLGPAGGDEGGEDETEPEEKPKAGKKPAKKTDDKDGDDDDDEPEKFGADFASAGDTFTPSTETKTKMSRYSDDRAAIDEIKATILRENADLRAAYNRTRAEKAVAELEEKHRIDFGGDDGREEEVKFLADLLGVDRGGKSFDVHCQKIAKKYARKAEQTPDAAGVDRAVRYSRTLDAAPAFSSPADIDAFLAARGKNPGLTPEQWAEQKTGKAK